MAGGGGGGGWELASVANLVLALSFCCYVVVRASTFCRLDSAESVRWTSTVLPSRLSLFPNVVSGFMAAGANDSHRVTMESTGLFPRGGTLHAGWCPHCFLLTAPRFSFGCLGFRGRCNLCGQRDWLWAFSDLALEWILDPNFLLDSVAFLSYAWTGILLPGVMREFKLLTDVVFRRRVCRVRRLEWLTFGRLCELRRGHPVLAVHWVTWCLWTGAVPWILPGYCRCLTQCTVPIFRVYSSSLGWLLTSSLRRFMGQTTASTSSFHSPTMTFGVASSGRPAQNPAVFANDSIGHCSCSHVSWQLMPGVQSGLFPPRSPCTCNLQVALSKFRCKNLMCPLAVHPRGGRTNAGHRRTRSGRRSPRPSGRQVLRPPPR